MKNIHDYAGFLNENNSTISVTAYNFESLKSKIKVLLSNEDDSNLKKGFEFVSTNINDYEKDEFVRDMCDGFFDKINTLIIKKYKNFWKEEDKGYSGFKFTGKNYDKTANLSINEISKMIKKELSIEYTDWKFSVKLDKFSGGQSITVDIKDMPYNPYSEKVDYAFKNDEHPNLSYNDEYYNETYLKDESKINHILNQYNFDDSNSQIDYFHSRYYSHLRISEDIKKKFYPDNADIKRSEEFHKEWNERAKKRKEIADAKKGKFKKGEEVIFIYDKESTTIPKGEYKAIILKSPNGRAMFSKYDIRFFVDKRKKNGEIIQLETPLPYLTTIYDESKFKKI